MDLILTEEQSQLQHTVREFVTQHSSTRRLRALRDARDVIGFSRSLWREMAKLGWLGIIFPEAHGGLGLGYTDLMVVLEELGRGLMPEPMLSTVLLGGTAVALGGTPAQQAEVLPPLISGDLLLALAYQEAEGRDNPHHVATRAAATASGWRLNGDKLHVLDGYGTDRLVVSARTAGSVAERDGVTLFLLDATLPGVSIERLWRIDSRNAASVRLRNVAVTPAHVLGAVGNGSRLLDAVLVRATVGLAAEMLGSMSIALETTIEYLKTRLQFGVPIGSFQALKHRAAKMYIETELARSAVIAAHKALDAQNDDAAALASVAKARCSDAFVLIADEMVQMHGGIGMTDEHDAGFFIKRARVAQMTFGTSAYHRNRFAELHSY